ncbi:MAG: hypothetical protein HY579_06650 [Nitrospinae bacterium]|nr:hypothetical protein [Nitrospinota bacterium]
MVDFLRKNPGVAFVVILLWGFQFFFFPFLHYHPGNAHGHEGALQPHEHKGHFHSHEFESVAHSINLHPSGPGLDKEHHHPHSAPEHDSDNYEVSLYKTGIQPEKHFQAVALENVFASFIIPERPSFHSVLAGVFIVPFPAYKDTRQERSPPSLFI